MRLGMMTSQFRKGREDDPFTTYKQQLAMCKQAGFSVLDLNMCAMIDGKTELNGDDWKNEAYGIREEADRLGLVFVQSHPPYRKTEGGAAYPNAEEEERYRFLTNRSLEISAITGVKWAVLHPGTNLGDDMLDLEANIRLNHEINGSFVELAEKLGLGIALENMRDNAKYRRFCSASEELTALVDSFHSPAVGACWDFGHANRNMHDQCRALRLLGTRIKATHVNDNHGEMLDEHLLPFMGNVDWKAILPVLKEIGYGGDLVFELSLTANMPMSLKMITMKYALEVGNYMLSLTEK